MSKLNDREKLIYEFMKDNDISITEIIDIVIKTNRLIGVGLITLEDIVVEAIKKHHKNDE